MRQPVGVGRAGDADGLEDTLAAQLVRDADLVVLGRGLLEVGLNAADVVHSGGVDVFDQRSEGVLELLPQAHRLGCT